MPDFEDQIAAIGFFQQPDRWIGIDFDHGHGAGIAINAGEQVDRGDAKPERACGCLRQRNRRLGGGRLDHHRSAGAQVHPSGNVAPFILRGVALLGINSVTRPKAERVEAWERLSALLSESDLERTVSEIGLGDVVATAGKLVSGQVRGRTVVDVNR